MSFKRVVSVLLVAFLIGGVFFLTSKPANHVQNAQKYYCPMHPSYVTDKPGKCPICNMTLVPMKIHVGKADDLCLMHECPMLASGQECPMILLPAGANGADCPICSKHLVESDKKGSGMSSPSPVRMDSGGQKKIGVRVETVSKRILQKTIPVQAKVAYDAELYDAELEFLQKIKRYKQPSSQIDPASLASSDRARLKLASMGISSEMIEEMKTWKVPDVRLIGADPNGQLWVYAYIYEEDLAYVREGSVLLIQNPRPGGEVIKTTIQYLDRIVQSTSRTVRARALIEDPEKIFKPDMYLQAELAAELGEVLAVPEAAVLFSGPKPYVFVQQSAGLFEPRTVTLGRKAQGYYEILSGLNAGESVIVSGNFLVDSESRIQSAIEGSGPGGEHVHG